MNEIELIARARGIAETEHLASVTTCQRNGPESARRATLRRLDDVLRSSVGLDDQTIACKSGCSHCCYIRVVASPIEIFGLIDYLRSSLDKAAFEAFEQRVSEAADLIRPLSRQVHMATNVACPALQDGRCIAYAARPLRCRVHHSRDVAICIDEYENPTITEGPSSQLPVRRFFGEAHVQGFEVALTHTNYDAGSYEFIAGMHEALTDAESRTRFNRKERAFNQAPCDRKSPLAE